MRNFRPHAPVVPRQPGTLTGVADDEVRRAVETQSKVEITNGRTTDWIYLGPKGFGTTQKIEHKLGRMPIGWFVAAYVGFPPKYRITDVDSKHISIMSLDQVDVNGRFLTDGAGAVVTTAQPLWSAAYTGAGGIYRITLQFDCVSLLSVEANRTTSFTQEFRYSSSSFAGPIYVDIVLSTGVAMLNDYVYFHIAVTGSDSQMKLWVY